MTINRNGIQFEPNVKWSTLIGWAAFVVFVPCVTAFGTMFVQGAVYGERIARLEDQSKDTEGRLRTIENGVQRLLVLAEKGAK